MAPRAKKHDGASIYQEGASGRWVAAVVVGREDGRPRRRKVTGRTRAEVEAKLADLRTTVERAPEHNGAMTVGAWLGAWLQEVERSRAPGTHRNYADVVELYVRPYVGPIRLAKLSPADVDRMMQRLAEKGMSANTIRLARSVLRRALTRAVHRGLIPRNVALGQYVEGPKIAGTAAAARYLSPVELGAFLAAAADHRLYAAMLLQAIAGLRSGEALGLRRQDVDLDHGLVTVAGALKRPARRGEPARWGETKTAQSRRTVAVPSVVVDAIRARLAAQEVEAEFMAGDRVGWSNPLGLIFTSVHGRPVDSANYRRVVVRAADLADAAERGAAEAEGREPRFTLGHVHPHDLRHTAASLGLVGTGDLKLVSALLGHSSVRVTGDVYAHLAAGATGAVTSAIADRLGLGATGGSTA